MKQLYFYMFDVIMLLYIYLPSWPDINPYPANAENVVSS